MIIIIVIMIIIIIMIMLIIIIIIMTTLLLININDALGQPSAPTRLANSRPRLKPAAWRQRANPGPLDLRPAPAHPPRKAILD